MNKIQVGLVTFGDHREPEWNKVFGKLTEERHKLAVETCKKLPIAIHASQKVARRREDINGQIDDLKRQGIEVFIAHTPCWTSPNLVVHGVQRMDMFTLMLGNKDMSTHGCVGLLGAAGTLAQIDHPHKRIRIDYHEAAYRDKLLPLIRAASVKTRLKGSVMGYFGGRSIGIDTATFDPMGWRKQFGVDVEHIDQVEIIRRAEEMDLKRIEKLRRWIEGEAKTVDYNDSGLTREKFDFQLGCYLATKDICREMDLDFTAVKCMPELSNRYVPQCMTAAFLADTYDGEEGEKESIAVACEADGDGALTQHILKIISGGRPTYFGDVSHIDDENGFIYCVNCGAICAWYAGRSSEPSKNIKSLSFRQSIRPGGGAITCGYAAPGPMQLARLYRKNGKYRMAIIPCEAVNPDQRMIDEFVAARGTHQLPVLFAKIGFDTEAFLDEYGSNHISGVAGNFEEELIEACHILGIQPVVFK
jgi:L-fucose isomerase